MSSLTGSRNLETRSIEANSRLTSQLRTRTAGCRAWSQGVRGELPTDDGLLFQNRIGEEWPTIHQPWSKAAEIASLKAVFISSDFQRQHIRAAGGLVQGRVRLS